MGVYTEKNRWSYSFPNVAFGTSSSQVIDGPKGKAGRLVGIHISATVLFTAVTTAGRIDIGTATSSTANASMALGTLAAGAALDASSLSTNPITSEDLAADVDVKVSFVAPTGGSPAGTGTVTVVIDWDN